MNELRYVSFFVDPEILRYVSISGSYRKFADEIARTLEAFRDLGVTVLSPKSVDILACVDGFASLRGDPVPRIDSVSENHLIDAMRIVEGGHLEAIKKSDALWIEIPGGYCGPATSFEVGWALAHKVPTFYDIRHFPSIREPIVRMYAHPTRGIEDLVYNFHSMPRVDQAVSRQFMQSHVVQPSVNRFNRDVAVGPIIVDHSKRYREGQPRDLLFVETYKYGGRISIVGDRLERGEEVDHGLLRATSEQTGLKVVVKDDVTTFDEIPGSGYYRQGTWRLLVDKEVWVDSKKVRTDHRASRHIWAPASVALRDFDLEPNARRSVEIFERRQRLVS